MSEGGALSLAQPRLVRKVIYARKVTSIRRGGFYGWQEMPGSGRFECLDACAQAAFMAGSLVFVDEATCAHPVKDGLGGSEGVLGGGGITCLNGLNDFFDMGTQHRALRRVALVTHNGLLGALFGGLDIGHGWNPETLGEEKWGGMGPAAAEIIALMV